MALRLELQGAFIGTSMGILQRVDGTVKLTFHRDAGKNEKERREVRPGAFCPVKTPGFCPSECGTLKRTVASEFRPRHDTSALGVQGLVR